MRELTVDDLRWVAGGLPASGNEGDIYEENGNYYQWYAGSWHEVAEPVYSSPNPPPPYEWPDPEPPPPGGGGSGTGAPPGPTGSNANYVTMITAPDNATYYAPQNVTNQTILNAISHLQSISNPIAKLVEFKNMYENPSNPYFIDFKDWGTANGPAGSTGAGNVTYWSAARGENYTGSAFEAFGNYIYGFVGIVGGIPQEALLYAAGLTQSGNNIAERILGLDGPEDRPHVMKGLLDGMGYLNTPHIVLSIVD